MAGISSHVRQLMREIGPIWGTATSAHVKLMVEAFTELHRGVSKMGIAEVRGFAYGPHGRQKLELFLPAGPGRQRPAVIFVHGGAFTEGDRNRTPEIYANVGRYFARHGIVGVNIGYRLAPEARYPDGNRDVGAAVAWTRRHAAEFGIDPAQVFVMGHSAGAAHSAGYALQREFHPPEGPGIAGLIVVSGRVRADNLPENPNAKRVEAYYGDHPSVYDQCSPVTYAGADSVPTFVAWSEYENPLLDVYCAELVYRLAHARRRAPPMVWLKGHNHTSIIAHLGLDEDVLGSALREFIARPE